VTKARFKSDAAEAILDAATGLRRAKLIDRTTMLEYEALCEPMLVCDAVTNGAIQLPTKVRTNSTPQ